MQYAGVIPNDVVNGEGVCVSLFTQGCPHHCDGCFNPETWDYEGGYTVPSDIRGQIVKLISANGIQRNFSILGGEPLCPENQNFVLDIITAVKAAYPTIKIYLWTGFSFEDIKTLTNTNSVLLSILEKIDVLIDGRFEKEKMDLTLKLRGSSNQHIYRKQENGDFKICDE